MKLVKINNIPAYSIGRVGDSIFIDVINIHPFEYPHQLYSNVINISKKISSDKITIYINFSKQYGYTKINTIQFNKKENNFDFSTDKEISYEKLLEDIKRNYLNQEKIIYQENHV